MLLRKAIQKTKIFFHKTVEILKSYLFGGYQKLPKSGPPNRGNSSSPKMQQLDDFYKDFSELWESDYNKKSVMSAKEPMQEEEEEEEVGNNPLDRIDDEEREKEDKHEGGKRGEPCPPQGGGGGGGGNVLAWKMRELEMMDMNDSDHVLDIEEVLHHYSRLNSPVYLDIVDKFFMDMYSEFFLPQAPSAGITNSSRRLGPLKL